MENENDLFYEDLILDKIKKAHDELESLRSEMETSGEDVSELSSLIDHQTKYLSSLESALVRLKNGTFGMCEQTGEEISPDRLKLVPNSNMSTYAKAIFNNFIKKNNK